MFGKESRMKSSSNAFVMSQGKKVGNLKGKTASAPKAPHKTAKPQAGPERKLSGPAFNERRVLTPRVQTPMGTTYSPVGEAMAKGPYKEKGQSLGQVNGGFKVHGK